MTKKIEELTQPNKEYLSELFEEMQEIMRQLKINGESIRQQIIEAEKEIEYRRSLGEDI
jgi:hypothetical protein